MLKAICMTTKRTVKKSKVITCHNCTFYNINAEHQVNDRQVHQYRSQRSATRNKALV